MLVCSVRAGRNVAIYLVSPRNPLTLVAVFDCGHAAIQSVLWGSGFMLAPESLVSIRLHWLWSHKLTEPWCILQDWKGYNKGVTGISGYTRISKVQYVMGAGQFLCQEWDNDVTMSVKVWNVYIGTMLGMGSGPTESVNIRLWSCDSGDGNDASVNVYDVEGCDWQRSGAKKNPDVLNRGSKCITVGS